MGVLCCLFCCDFVCDVSVFKVCCLWGFADDGCCFVFVRFLCALRQNKSHFDAKATIDVSTSFVCVFIVVSLCLHSGVLFIVRVVCLGCVRLLCLSFVVLMCCCLCSSLFFCVFLFMLL